MNIRDELEQQLKDLEAQKVTLFDSGSADQVEVGRINEKIKGIQQQLSALETKAAIIAEAQDPESSFALTVDGMVVDFRAEAANEGSYQALRIVTQLKLQELEQQNQAEIKALRSSWEIERRQFEMQIDSLEEAKSSAQFGEENFKQANQVLSDQLHDANLQNADLERKRSIAASEIESLKVQVEDLRNQVSKPNVPTNLDNGALAEAIRASQAAKPAIYDVVKDQANINFTAKLLENDEVVDGKVVYIGKYRIASVEEVQRFQSEMEAAKNDIPDSAGEFAEAAEVPSNEPEVTIEAPTFPTEVSDADNGSQLGGDTAETESVQNHDGGSVEERLAALELAVFGSVKAAA